ncbi:hypothetical protein [Mucilaginibacter jinjuensis]|uniref:Uncharacterized protein n=1 Tax=Mucilaginibacter jinjuensis TaxID=1176721 RepID=A0ABY7TF72_9SPHI|nr:hypothetical protein [Mucilaginibacter jinjuensis]WCT14884.1 hypothetical protein PQO05_13145 [Mucilaginibacter jinjuensis]
MSVQGKVYGSKDIGSMVLVNLGAAYPNQLLTVVLKGKAKDLGSQLDNKTIKRYCMNFVSLDFNQLNNSH